MKVLKSFLSLFPQNYDESGSPRRTTCLKYLVLASMLVKSGKDDSIAKFAIFCSDLLNREKP